MCVCVYVRVRVWCVCVYAFVGGRGKSDRAKEGMRSNN